MSGDSRAGGCGVAAGYGTGAWQGLPACAALIVGAGGKYSSSATNQTSATGSSLG